MKLFKTKPFKHQLKALKLSKDAKAFALLMEQGTGKSKVTIDTIAHLWRARKIDTVLIIAPKGVAPAWLRQQLPIHMPDDIEYVAGLWKSSLTRMAERNLKNVIGEKDKLRIVIMNVEAFGSTATAIDFAIEYLDNSQSAMVVVDESHRIKTPQASTTKRIVKHLRIRSAYRRILTGTIGDKPFDLFSQFGFLDPAILGVTSFVAFKSEYAEMLPPTDGLMRHIMKRVRNPAKLPQIVATNSDGTPKYRNLNVLQGLIAPFSYRVLKKDCLDLPEQLYNRYYTELGDQQAALYERVREDHRIEWEEGRVSTFNQLTVYLRLQQIICGYVPGPDGAKIVELFPTWSENPRIVSTLELIADRPERERAIVWCRFREDIRRVCEALRESYGAASTVEFHGGVKDHDRLENVARFEGERQIINKSGNVIAVEKVDEKDRAKFMVSQQQSGGVGQTWIAASHSVFYSNTFSYIDRKQAEDRPHRQGQRNPVQYNDIEAEDTIDSVIIGSMIAKKEVADTLNNDAKGDWLK